ncbi:MAG TPA: J domain-containing protein [Armatimonadaceae bacterium]|nr:J domain-containing protein [Armatimonadaceae bacterium]
MEDGPYRNGTNGSHDTGDSTRPAAAAEDPYALLGVPRGATLLDVKRSYREKVKACHPDLVGNDAVRIEEFKRLTRAYKTLSDLLHTEPAGVATGPSAAPPSSAAPARRVDTVRAAELAALNDLIIAGRARLDAGDYAGVETMARAALARSRECADAYVLMGESLAARQLYAEATGCFRLALQIAPDNAEARAQLDKLRHRQESGQGAAR